MKILDNGERMEAVRNAVFNVPKKIKNHKTSAV